MKLVSTVLVLYPILICQSYGANILIFMAMGSYSHRITMEPWMNALADKGHNITFISGYVPKTSNPKVNDFTPPGLLKYMDNVGENFNIFEFRKSSKILLVSFMLPQFGIETCEALYSDPEVLTWLKNPATQFDVVVMDPLMNECVYGMVHHFKAKLVAFNTGQLFPWSLETHIGLPDETSSIPDGTFHFNPPMSFLQRVVNAVHPLVWKAIRELWYLPKLEEITKKALDLKEIPRFTEIEANTSLYFLNSYFGQEFARSLPPNVVPVGGIYMHGKKTKPLPKQLEDFINKGKDGFIYVSFGTVAEFTKFDREIREAFVNMTYKFPNLQFIWKSKYGIKEKLPSNVYVDKWLPQADILGHPKIRVFVTHAGLGGIYEATYNKVPMICFPVFAEQEYNSDIIVQKGNGIKLEVTTLKESEIVDAVTKILTESSFKRQAEKISKLLRDRPISPLDTALWWMEFILENDDTNEFLRPLSVGQSWWVRRQLDVWIFVLIATIFVFSIILSIAYMIFRAILRCLCGSSKSKRDSNGYVSNGSDKKAKRRKYD